LPLKILRIIALFLHNVSIYSNITLLCRKAAPTITILVPGTNMHFKKAYNAKIALEAALNDIKASESLTASMRRTKRNIIDLIYNNPFELWVTFTFAGDKRADVEYCRTQLSLWLKQQKRKYGNFSYLIVMELHKDGAPHFHGLLHDYKGLVIDAHNPYTGQPLFRTRKGARYQQFNLGEYKLGFTSVEYIENKHAVAQYMTKYVTKSLTTFAGKKRYFASSDLKKPEKEYNTDYEKKYQTTLGFDTDSYSVLYVNLENLDSPQSLSTSGKG